MQQSPAPKLTSAQVTDPKFPNFDHSKQIGFKVVDGVKILDATYAPDMYYDGSMKFDPAIELPPVDMEPIYKAYMPSLRA